MFDKVKTIDIYTAWVYELTSTLALKQNSFNNNW